MTVKRRCRDKMLPLGHYARKIPGAKGAWVIEVINENIARLNLVVGQP